ncbi:MAG: hypothetical protein KJZ78_24375, partial [Bryobacteraceae bacterium]|nr:hypothetical protein [Bryobacteraceae bacterium]
KAIELFYDIVGYATIPGLFTLKYAQQNTLYSIEVEPDWVTTQVGQSARFNVKGVFGGGTDSNSIDEVIAELYTKLVTGRFDPGKGIPAQFHHIVKEAFENLLKDALRKVIGHRTILREKSSIVIGAGSATARPVADQYARLVLFCGGGPEALNSFAVGIQPTGNSATTFEIAAKNVYETPSGGLLPWTTLRVRVVEPTLTTDHTRYTEGQTIHVTGQNFPANRPVFVVVRIGAGSVDVNADTDATGRFTGAAQIPWTVCDFAPGPGFRCGTGYAQSLLANGEIVRSAEFAVNATIPSIWTDRRIYKPGHGMRVSGTGFPHGAFLTSTIRYTGATAGPLEHNTPTGAFTFGATVPNAIGTGSVITRVRSRDWTLASWFVVQEDCELDETGACRNPDPTFIQPPEEGAIKTFGLRARSKAKVAAGLEARIDVPRQNSLVRAGVPIFGIAAGSEFAEYRVEVGQGDDPSSWTLLSRSTGPQTNSSPVLPGNSADLTILGNLATWDTGLKSYVYLPMYPRDHPVDLKGTWTVRLVVAGKDGRTAEDRVQVEVGEVIPNAWGGEIRSDDGQAALYVPPWSLSEPFRLLSIVRDTRKLDVPAAPNGQGPIYRVRDPGAAFAETAQFTVRSADPEASLAIAAYDPAKRQWTPLPTQRTADGRLSADIREAAPYYTLVAASQVAPMISSEKGSSEPGLPGGVYFVNQDFESDAATWRARNPFGAEVSPDRAATRDGTGCLRVTNRRAGGSFVVQIL